jgi:SAM-dependent methyltransferase
MLYIIFKNILALKIPPPYYYNPCIHNMGNTGVMGTLHAIAAPLFTKVIDKKAYNGRDVRKEIYNELDGSILDLCCGVGFSTKPGQIGIDTSKEMLKFANFYNPGSQYLFGNAENYGEDNSYDYVTCMFSFHEMPNEGHSKIIENSIRIAKKEIIIVDISTNYTPSKLMLAGEPYISNYIDTIDFLLKDFNKTTLIQNHVDVWRFSIN